MRNWWRAPPAATCTRCTRSFRPRCSRRLPGSRACRSCPVAPGSDVIQAERRRITESLEEICRSHGLEPDRVRLEQGFAVELLPRLAETLGADLLVMGAISRSRLRELFIGSTAERILDRLHCDVLVVKSEDFAEDLPF